MTCEKYFHVVIVDNKYVKTQSSRYCTLHAKTVKATNKYYSIYHAKPDYHGNRAFHKAVQNFPEEK